MNDAGSYLINGYCVDEGVPDWFADLSPASDRSDVCNFTPAAAGLLLDDIIDNELYAVNGVNIVPISGGWDSRIILGSLTDRTDNVATVTVGCPGQLDYEIGRQVSNACGVENIQVNLENVELKWDELVRSARNSHWTYMPDSYFIGMAYQKAKEKYNKINVWSGFLGEALTGGHYEHGIKKSSWEQSVQHFSRTQMRCPKSWLSRLNIEAGYFPDNNRKKPHFMSNEEYLDLSIRQRSCIAGIVLGGRWSKWQAGQGMILGTSRIVAPFASASWASFWLSAPRELHRDQSLYYQMATMKFPVLFQLPSKHSFGVGPNNRLMRDLMRLKLRMGNKFSSALPWAFRRSRIMDNYLDFEHAFRYRDDYKAVIEKSVQIAATHPVAKLVEPEKYWDEHRTGKRNNATPLQLILGLAVNLAANTEPA